MQIAFSPAFSPSLPANGGGVTDTSEWAQHALERTSHAIATIHASTNMRPRDSEPFSHDDPAVLVGLALRLGKTTFARSLAKSAGLPLIASSVGQWFSGTGKGNLGDVIREIDALFDAAAAAAPSILFLDELDALPDRRALSSRNRDWWLTVVNHVLTKLDGAVSAQARDLIIIGATNYPERLDATLLRPRQLSKVTRIGLPSSAELMGIFRQHLGPDLPEADLSLVTRLACGATGADVAGWVKSARRIARQQHRALHPDDLLELVAPAEHRSPAEVQRVAIHEAAHAVIGHALGHSGISEISIVRRGTIGGSSAWQGETSSLQTRADLEAHIQTLLAGAVPRSSFSGKLHPVQVAMTTATWRVRPSS